MGERTFDKICKERKLIFRPKYQHPTPPTTTTTATTAIAYLIFLVSDDDISGTFEYLMSFLEALCMLLRLRRTVRVYLLQFRYCLKGKFQTLPNNFLKTFCR